MQPWLWSNSNPLARFQPGLLGELVVAKSCSVSMSIAPRVQASFSCLGLVVPGAPDTTCCSPVALAWLGGLIAIATVAGLTNLLSVGLVLGSLGATCVLVFGYADVPFSQPGNVILGHFLSSFVGLVCLSVFGAHWWAVALAVAMAIALMMVTRTVHPPAGSNPVIVFLLQPSWSFLFFPSLVGALVVMAVALIYNNASREARYPKYW